MVKVVSYPVGVTAEGCTVEDESEDFVSNWRCQQVGEEIIQGLWMAWVGNAIILGLTTDAEFVNDGSNAISLSSHGHGGGMKTRDDGGAYNILPVSGH